MRFGCKVPGLKRMLQVRRFFRLGWGERTMVAEAFLFLVTARLILIAVPFRRVAAWLGTFVPAGTTIAPDRTPLDAQQRAVAIATGSVVALVARAAGYEATCLSEAIAARLMLRRRDIPTVLHFGVSHPNGEERLEAHAWLEADAINVTGGSIADSFIEIARVL
jgi:hypothetical protein